MTRREFCKYGEEGAYHLNGVFPMENRIRRFCPWLAARYELPFILARKYFDTRLVEQSGLDVGCGEGAFVATMLRRGGTAIGVDASREGITLGLKEIPRRIGRKPDLQCASAYQLPFLDNQFDFIVSLELVEHLEQPDRFLSEMARVLRPGGLLILSTPNALCTPAEKDPYHVIEYGPDEFRRLLGTRFSDVKLFGYLPRFLFDLYRESKIARGILKLSGALFVNPFSRIVTRHSFKRFVGLLAICKK